MNYYTSLGESTDCVSIFSFYTAERTINLETRTIIKSLKQALTEEMVGGSRQSVSNISNDELRRSVFDLLQIIHIFLFQAINFPTPTGPCGVLKERCGRIRWIKIFH